MVEYLSKELKLLLQFLKVENTQTLFDKQECFHDIDWANFLLLARHHRIYPMIYQRLKKLGHPSIPSHVMESLHKGYMKNTFQMLRLSGEMECLSKQFSSNQIQLLFLKGPVLAAALYGDISLRTSSDLDVLVPIHRLEQADELLFQLGYVKEDYFSTVLSEWRWRHHHLTYFHPEKGIKLEVHWRQNPGPSKEPNFRELWERKRVSSISKFPVYLLGREDLFLFLVSHGARHGWSRLRWLLDIHQILKQEFDWSRTVRLLKKYQCFHTGGQALLLASTLLGTPLTREMKVLTAGNRPRRLAEDALFYIKQMINLHTDPVPEDVARYHKHHLFSLMSSRQKLLFILSFFYPYPMDAETLPLPKTLHFLYFPLRPVLWVWRRARQHV
jgi:hypothetical protein